MRTRIICAPSPGLSLNLLGSTVSRNPAATRRLARNAALAQLLVGLVVALAVAALSGQAAGIAAMIGATAVALGTLLMGRALLDGGVSTATGAMMRFVAGTLAKWVLVLAIGVLAIGVWKLPPLPLLAGLVVALAASAVMAMQLR